jgi:hypothetical protein
MSTADGSIRVALTYNHDRHVYLVRVICSGETEVVIMW